MNYVADRCRNNLNDLDPNAEFHCSTAYHNRAYARYLCPYEETSCGSSWNFTLADASNRTVTVSNLGAGRNCLFAVKTGCSLPAFTVSTSAAAADYEVEYVEFESNALNNTGYFVWSGNRALSNAATVRNAAPAWNSPPRYTRFANATGSAAIFRAQIPTTTTLNVTSMATSGRYVESLGGWKVFGMNDQQAVDYTPPDGTTAEGTCKDRHMYVSVFSNKDTTITESITVTFAALTEGIFIQITGLVVALSMLVSWI